MAGPQSQQSHECDTTESFLGEVNVEMLLMTLSGIIMQNCSSGS